MLINVSIKRKLLIQFSSLIIIHKNFLIKKFFIQTQSTTCVVEKQQKLLSFNFTQKKKLIL